MEKQRVPICCIFFSINARSSAVTGTRSTMFLVRFAIRSPSFLFPIRVWDYPSKQCPGRGFFGSVATLPMLATVSLFLLLLRWTPCIFPKPDEKSISPLWQIVHTIIIAFIRVPVYNKQQRRTDRKWNICLARKPQRNGGSLIGAYKSYVDALLSFFLATPQKIISEIL